MLRHDWTDAEILAIYELPLPELMFRAQEIHRANHRPTEVQLCTLLSIKTGGCSEDCGYCPQSAHFSTGLPAQDILPLNEVLEAAGRAQAQGATRFCMGAAWRNARTGSAFDQVLSMIEGVSKLGLEPCATLGMLTPEQAVALKKAGLVAYNHNLDSGPDFYPEVVSTRSYSDRLRTLRSVREAGLTMCSGGIIGMGESKADRAAMLRVLAAFDPHPESVPINALVRVEGTPFADRPKVDGLEMARMIATARIVLPKSRVRLSAGRTEMSEETQALCFLAGANSIFFGDKLLTTQNPEQDTDRALLDKLGLRPEAPRAQP
ncbi:MAG: biotin synthase BioB [Myxococcota bacterium]